jgi:hypothetical protein
MDFFDGNYGEITGDCPTCGRKAQVTIVVCDYDRLQDELNKEE